jgi:hypothetical protein
MPSNDLRARPVRFGVFEVDLVSGEIRKAGVKLRVGGQPFQVLAILLERPSDTFTREELQKGLWPDTFVDIDHKPEHCRTVDLNWLLRLPTYQVCGTTERSRHPILQKTRSHSNVDPTLHKPSRILRRGQPFCQPAPHPWSA